MTNVEKLVSSSDVLICATSSREAILKTNWLKSNIHINNIGPKMKGNAELPFNIYSEAQYLYTDSMQQALALHDSFILSDDARLMNKLYGLGSLSDKQINLLKRRKNGVSIFLSLGISATEVAMLKTILSRH